MSEILLSKLEILYFLQNINYKICLNINTWKISHDHRLHFSSDLTFYYSWSYIKTEDWNYFPTLKMFMNFDLHLKLKNF